MTNAVSGDVQSQVLQNVMHQTIIETGSHKLRYDGPDIKAVSVLTRVHDPFVNDHVGLGGELLVAVRAPEPLLALVDGLHVLHKLRSGTFYDWSTIFYL